MRHRLVQLLILVLVTLLPTLAATDSGTTRPATLRSEWTSAPEEIDDEANFQSSVQAVQDTQWIADWSFDGGNPCDPMGWTAVDLRGPAPQPQPVYWSVGSDFGGIGGISGNAAILTHHDLCWVIPDGYGNDWYQAIAVRYQGQTLLSVNDLLDSEAGFDFFQIEADSACASAQTGHARQVLFSDDGFTDMGSVNALLLPDFSAPQDTHCVYLAFFSDAATSQEDGLLPTQLGAGLVIDHIVLADAGNPGSPGLITFTEDFEGTLNPLVSFTTLTPSPSGPGPWARLEPLSVTCRRHPSCGWVFSDPDLICLDAAGFGCVPEGIDNVIISPWVSLASTPGSQSTFLRFRELQGPSSGFRIVRSWSVRSLRRIDDTDTPTPGDSLDCPTAWRHTSSWNSLGSPFWMTDNEDLTTWIDPNAVAVQVRFRVSDWNWISGGSSTDPTGPGPWIDRVRIGRSLLTGPVISEGIDSRSQAQDCFPTEIDPTFPGGERYRPSTDRFGTCAFSPGGDIGVGTSPRLVLGDSIWVEVTDAGGAGGVTTVDFYGAIVLGPHAGKSPPPWTVEANGFFRVPADSVRTSSSQALAGFWFVDLDDDYFRGGDELVYLWLATDAQGGMASDPIGLDHVPTSIQEAQQATEGLLEVNFLPRINWDPLYLARVQADPHGKLEPTPQELANSSQANCILYTQTVNPRRRRSLVFLHDTSLMYVLDRLSYRGHYDVYDVQGYGNTNNQLAGRATIEQAEGYNLLIAEAGNLAPGAPILPDGSDLDAQKLDQAGWYRSWLAQASGSEAQFATLWLLGSNIAEEKSTNPLIANDLGVILAGPNQSMGVSPDVEGQTSFTFDKGIGSSSVNFTGDLFSLAGGCLSLPREVLRIRNYDALEASGTAVVTHRYRSETSLGEGAIVMNRNNAEAWNTILTSFPWLDIRDVAGTPANPPPEGALLAKILGGVLPPECLASPEPTGVANEETLATPRQTVLHSNTPNPFNPVTTIEFDLAARGNVQLRLYDVAGRLVRTLVDEVHLPARHRVMWDGRDDHGRPVPTGIYFARLHAGDYEGSRKLVVLR